jgi:hypothetical protein
MSKDNSGPAFPFECGDNNGMPPCYGMTLRDYFAAKAMQGMLSNPAARSNDSSVSDAEAFANASYKMADAMLAEREKGQ